MTKIAFVVDSFVRAGSQRHILEIIKGIIGFNQDINCVLFLLAEPDEEWGTYLPEVRHAGASVIIAPYLFVRNSGSGIVSRAINWWSRNYRERTINHSFFKSLAEFPVVVCVQPFVADLLLPHLQYHQRLCFHLSEHPSQRRSRSHYKFLQHPRLNIIFQHPNQVPQFKALLPHQNTLIWPLRLCQDHFIYPITPSLDPDNRLRIAHYSRISPMRLIDRVVSAFALLHRQIPSSLRIAGHIEDLAYHKILLAQVVELGLEGAVTFDDPVPVPADDPARNQVDLVWMISLSGHIGYAALESMAAGFPTLLLEVDSPADPMPADPDLDTLICSTPEQLVDRSLALQNDPIRLREQQSQLMRRRFLTTQEGIDDLVSFYLGWS